jgi:hypothetical protein
MGDWEISVQLPNGAVRAGRLNLADPNPAPAIFNTGQVLLGWTALLKATGETRYREAGLKAAEWMMEQQEPDGNWIRGNSPMANPATTTYNVKAAWGLCGFGIASGFTPAVEAAVKNGDFALRRQLPNGWYEGCCLTDAAQPLLHTIAYSMQGLIGIGRLTGEQRFVEGAIRTARSLMGLMDADGFLPGRINRDFEGTVTWCCLTGSAQTSEVWWQLYELTKEEAYRSAALRVNRYLMARHDITSKNPAVRGGMAGSWPVQGDYGRYLVLNWATKFFLDALLGQCRHGMNAG